MEKYPFSEPVSNRVSKHLDSQFDPDTLPEKGLENISPFFDKIEIKKGRQERMAISWFNNFLSEEAARYGVKIEPLPLERIKIVDESSYDDLLKKDTTKSLGVYSTTAGMILLRGENLKSFHVLMHELLHYYSFQKIDEDENGERVNARLGYDGFDSRTFVGFNEGVTEITAASILAKHREEIEGMIGVFRNGEVGEAEKEAFFRPAPGRFTRFVRLVAEKMAEKNGKTPEEVLEKFKEGMFTGRMMPLREIEKVFGPGSLRLLAYYDVYESSETDKMIYGYFQDPDKGKSAEELVAELEQIRSGKKMPQAA